MGYEEILFPYENIRDEQKKLIEDVKKAIEDEKNLLVHAPTGLGKTISVLGPALRNAIEKNRTVFFLTSRHTQHILAVKTLRDIKKKFEINITCCDIIGKRWMCSQPGAENMLSSQFSDYCKSIREEGVCEFYINTRDKSKTTPKAEKILADLREMMPTDTETINRICRAEKLCPYEIAALLARESKVVIADYNYIFDEKIRESFFIRANKKLKESIIIVDEGHNLPSRCRDMLSVKLSNVILDRAIKEAKKFEYKDAAKKLDLMLDVLKELASDLEEDKKEDYIFKGEFFKKVDSLIKYDESRDEFYVIGDHIREVQKLSYVWSVGLFMESWMGDDKGYLRSIKISEGKQGDMITIGYSCLDPSFVSGKVVNETCSTIIMSGTLTPGEMYADLLGFKNYNVKEYSDPFSEKNRLNLIIEEVTTKYSVRNEEQYRKIAQILADIVNVVPGNTFVFFPSYEVRNFVNRYFERLSKRTVFLELPGMSKEEKKDFLEKFKGYKAAGAVLLGVASGSFGEGVDLPGDLLKCVVVIGIPLNKPDLETKELIEYYNDKYGEGINYGYIYPAITKTLQNAGRCIRSEKDRGVIVFMDARYNWENYRKCFPKYWDMKITKMWKDRVEKFFS